LYELRNVRRGGTEAVGSGSKYKLGVRHEKRISEEDQVWLCSTLQTKYMTTAVSSSAGRRSDR
jgi:hypothetical protein